MTAATTETSDTTTPGRTDRRRTTLAGAVTILFTLWVALPFVWPGGWVTSFDAVAYSGPNLMVTFEALRDGHLPHWNDLIFGGVTHLGNPQAAVMYPLLWALAWLDAHQALVLASAIHLAVLAGGMWVLLRHRLRLEAVAAAAGTITLLGSGAVMTRAIQFEQLSVVAWVPWVLVAADRVVAAPRPWRAMAVAAAAAAVMGVAGHPQQAYLAAPLVVVWSIGRALDHRRPRRLLHLAGAGAVAALLASAQLVPVLATLSEAAPEHQLQVTDTTVADPEGPAPASPDRTGALRLYSAVDLRVPVTLLGDPTSSDPVASAGGYEHLAFVGAAAATLAVLGVAATVLHRRREGAMTVALLVATAASGVLLALGPRTVVYRVLYEHMPGFDQARAPGRWMLVAVIAVSILVAVGTQHIARATVRREAVLGAAAAMGLGLLTMLAGPFDNPGVDTHLLWLLAIGGVAVLAWRSRGSAWASWAGVAVLAVVVVELAWMQRHALARDLRAPERITEHADEADEHTPDGPGWTLALTHERLGDPEYLIDNLRPNANVLTSTASLDGYDGGVQVTARWARAVAALSGETFDPELTLRSQVAPPVDPEVAARVGIRWVLVDTSLVDPEAALPGWDGPVRTDGPSQLYENPEWSAAAHLLRRAVPIEEDDALGARLRSLPADAVGLEDPSLLSGGCEAPCPAVPLEVDHRRPEQIEVHVRPESVGVLRVHQRFDPGWEVEVDGEARTIVQADGWLLGTVVEPGDRVVRFHYRAPGSTAGMGLSALGAVAAGGLAIAPRRRRGASA